MEEAEMKTYLLRKNNIEKLRNTIRHKNITLKTPKSEKKPVV